MLQICFNVVHLQIDIDRDPVLRRRYDEWVPVLCHGDREICYYHLDEAALMAVFSASSAAGDKPR